MKLQRGLKNIYMYMYKVEKLHTCTCSRATAGKKHVSAQDGHLTKHLHSGKAALMTFPHHSVSWPHIYTRSSLNLAMLWCPRTQLAGSRVYCLSTLQSSQHQVEHTVCTPPGKNLYTALATHCRRHVCTGVH